MRAKLLQSGAHAPWQEGEIVTVQVVAVADVGVYDVETLETFPADLKDTHAKQLVDLQRQLDEARASTPVAEEESPQPQPRAVKPAQTSLPADPREKGVGGS